MVALVTGASSGIGAAIVRALRASGREVVAVARRADRLEALAQETGCTPRAVDLRDFDAADALVRKVGPSILVNNAGTGHGIAGLEKAGEDDLAVSVETNILSPLRLTRAALPAMRERGEGHVVMMGSIAGLYPIVSAAYGASKGAVHLMSQNLRVELRGSGIRLTEIAPGRTASEFYDAGNLGEDDRTRLNSFDIEPLRPADVARAVMFALDSPSHVNIGLIELTPAEQALGGIHMVPNPKRGE